MSALTDALARLTAGAVLRRLAAHLGKPTPHLIGSENEGALCDLRDGLEEEDPSLSYKTGNGGPIFTRFGGDGFQGGALAFLVSAGIPQPEAVALLLDWAGVPDEKRTPGEAKRPGAKVGRGKARTPTAPAKKEKARRFDAARTLEKLAAQGPVQPDALASALRGWERLTADSEGPEAADLARRGLLPALASGLLTAYRFTGQAGPEGGPQKTVRLPGYIRPGAVAFEVRGPDGQVWAVKVRNPGSKEELKEAGANRYAYLTKGGHSPAWCAPDFLADLARPVLNVEGELNAVACAVMLEAAGQASAYRVQGVASADAWPHVQGVGAGSVAHLYADPDGDGDAARESWGKLCAHMGAEVQQVRKVKGGRGVFSLPSALDVERGEVVTQHDACDYLSPQHRPGVDTPEAFAAKRGAALLEAIGRAVPWVGVPDPSPEEEDSPADQGQGQAGDVWLSKREGFGLRHGVLCALAMKKGHDGEEYETAEALANFAVYITGQVQTEDGTGEAPLRFEVAGKWATGAPMRPLCDPVVTAAEFSGLAWVVRIFGARAIVRNGQGRKDKMREGIQRTSEAEGIEDRTVHAQTGWIIHPEHGPLYLTAGAVIGRDGAVSGVEVDLGPDLNAYALPDPAGRAMPGSNGEEEDARQAVRASLDLLALAPDAVGVPVFGTVYRAPLGRSDAVTWGTGETGRNKTALMGLAQAHFGAGWNRHRLPEGWQSTANGLEKTAHTLKDVLLLIDDFKPSGSQTDINRAHGNVSRILSNVADGVGRTRLGIDRQRRAGLAPRGTVMSSSETLPRGHSNLARVVVVPVESKLIHSPAMSRAYYAAQDMAERGVYALATSRYAQWIAAHHDAVTVGSLAHKAMTRALAPHFPGDHGRTGPAAAELAYGWATWLTFAVEVGATGEEEASQIWARVVSALRDTAQGQGAHLKEEDPVDRALSLLSGLLSQGAVFLEDAAGSEAKPPPDDVAHLYGWQAKPWQTDHSEGVELRTRPGARLIGYYNRTGGDEWGYFLTNALHGELQRAAQAQGAGVLPDASTLYSNMKDRFFAAGMMRCEVEKGGEGKAGRVRPTWKTTARGQSGRFVALRLPIDPEAYNLGNLGNMGNEEGLSTSSTALSKIPTFNIFIDCLGKMGNPSLSGPSLSPSAVPPAGPLEDPSWDELTGGVLEGEDLAEPVKL